MIENTLVTLAANDRHDPIHYNYKCTDCGSHVSTYNCNSDLIACRPEGHEWDWWIACDNGECKNNYGEGFWQTKPEWSKGNIACQA